VTLARVSASHVLARIRRGASSSPVVVETNAGRFVVKLRGAGHGTLALVAELVVAALAERLGVPVPERVLLELSADFRSDDKNDELADLLVRSVGLNVGFRLLDGAREPRPEELERLHDEFAARVLWLDGLTQNPDRTHSNPNILLWKLRPWLIDHGSALPFQYDWPRVTESSPREAASYANHVFEARTALLPRYDATLARLVNERALTEALAEVPDELFDSTNREPSARVRAAYHAFLWKRLKAPRPFIPA
jgi:hypothetical protein